MRGRKRWGVVVAAVLAGLTLVVAAALWFLDGWLERYAEGTLVELRDQLQRPVRVADLEVSVWRGRARATELYIGAGDDEPSGTPPALRVASAEVRVGLLRTLLSLGARPHVRSIHVEGMEAHVVRLPDGTLNWQRMAERYGEREAEPADPATQRRLQQTVVDDLHVRESEIVFLQPGAEPREARISQIDLRFEDVALARGAGLRLAAAVLQPERNLQMEGRVAGLGEDATAYVEHLVLRMSPTQLAPLAPFMAALGPDGRTPERGVFGADVRMEEAQRGRAEASGQLSFAGLRFPGGAEFDARLDLDVAMDEAAGRLTVRDVVFRLGEMQLRVRGAFSDLDEDVPQVESLDVRSEALSFDRLRALYPPWDQVTEPLRLRGPFSIRAASQAASQEMAGSNPRRQLDMALALTELSTPDDVEWPESEADDEEPGLFMRLLAGMDGSVALDVRQGRILGIAYQGFESRARIRDGRAVAEVLEVSVFGGQLSGSGSELPLLDEAAPRRLRGSVREVSVAALLAQLVGSENLLGGDLSATFDVEMAGADATAWARTLSGRMQGALANSTLLSGNGYLSLAEQLAARADVPGLQQVIQAAPQRLQLSERWPLGELRGVVEFEEGAVLIPEPLTATTPQGQLRVEGRASATDDSDLRGRLSVSPQAVGALIGRDAPVNEPIPVPFRVRGPLTSPVFEFEDVGPLLRPLAAAYVRRQVGDVEREVRERVPQRLRRLLD